MVGAAIEIAQRLAQDGLSLEVVNASTIRPLDGSCLARLAERGKPVITLEEHGNRYPQRGYWQGLFSAGTNCRV